MQALLAAFSALGGRGGWRPPEAMPGPVAYGQTDEGFTPPGYGTQERRYNPVERMPQPLPYPTFNPREPIPQPLPYPVGGPGGGGMTPARGNLMAQAMMQALASRGSF